LNTLEIDKQSWVKKKEKKKGIFSSACCSLFYSGIACEKL